MSPSHQESECDPVVGAQPLRGEMIKVEKFPRTLLHRLLKRMANSFFSLLYKSKMGSLGANSHVNLPTWIKGHQSIYIGRNVQIWRFSRITAINARPGERRITISDDCVIHPSIHISAVSSVYIGRSVLIAANCYITDHDHLWQRTDIPAIMNAHLIAEETRIGDKVWIGEKVVILKGVTIGENSVIGSGSVVTKSIPPFSVAVGNPARVIRSYDHESGTWVCVHEDSTAHSEMNEPEQPQ